MAGPLNYWLEKNRAKFGPVQYGQVRYGPTRPGPSEFFLPSKVFRAGWATKILSRNIRANFDPARFWPSPLLARPTRLPALVVGEMSLGESG